MKVAIIGGGIVGLYLAWKLAERGQAVILFEKKEKIGKKICSGLFSERILEFIPQSQKLIENQIDSVLIHFPAKTLKIKFSRKFFIIDHSQLDNLVFEEAKKTGAKIILNQNVTRTFLAKLEDDFEKIIGCDGVNSIVRKSLNLPEPKFRLALQGFISEIAHSNFVETWPTKSGFFWKIPRSNEIEYGAIEEPKRAREIFDDFLNKNNLRLAEIKSALLAQGLIIPSDQKITLSGEAAGLTKPWSGGGVVWGLMASDILLKNFPDFSKYKKEVKKFFLPRIIFSKIATKMVYFLGFNFPWILPKNIKIEGDFLI